MLEFDKQVLQQIYRDSSPHVQMRLTHLPTGRTVTGETYSSQYRLREKLLRRLRKEVEDMEDSNEENVL